MKIGLEKLPGLQDLEKAYNEILHAQRTQNGKIDLNTFAIFCQWSRFDSRMGEICVSFLSRYWKGINPVELHDSFAQQAWPNVLGVLLEFSQNESPLFQFWKMTATCDFQKANWEQFFIGKRRIGGKLMLDDARFSLEEYRRWGYLGREILLNKQGQVRLKSGSYSPETRSRILKEMLKTQARITVSQYRDAIGRSISARQAERDLQTSSYLKAIGATKGRYFVKR